MAENRNPDTVDIDLMDSLKIARSINREDTKVAAAVSQVLPDVARAIDLAAEALRSGGRLGYFGAGTSGKIAILDATDCPQTFGIDENLIQSFIAAATNVSALRSRQRKTMPNWPSKTLKLSMPAPATLLSAFRPAATPPMSCPCLQKPGAAAPKPVAVTSNPQAKFKPYADVFINPLVGSEAIDGSSRMKSGSAQKMILNMISTGAMIRLGKTYENLMIDVNVSNEKLYRRALDMIGADYRRKPRCRRKMSSCRGQKRKNRLCHGRNELSRRRKPKGFWRKNDGSLRKVLQQGKENV